MELAVLAAHVNFRRQRRDEFRVNVATHGVFAKIRIIYAADDRAEAERNEFADQFARINFPKRENSVQADARQIFLAPAFEVFEKNVAKDAAGDAARLVRQQACGHLFLILLVGTALADEDFLQRQADGFGLRVEQFQPHAVHGDALEMFVTRRQQRGDFVAAALQNSVQGERGIFAATPAKYDFLFEHVYGRSARTR